MSTGRQSVTVQDLVEEAKKRIVFLVICVVGLSYIMSLTSSSVWVNLPAAALLIVILRYFSLDFDMRRKAAAYYSKPARESITSQRKPFESSKVLSEWRNKVNSPAVEDAIDQFTRHLISEWVTDLWYSRITPDRQAPEELVQIMNDVMGEISHRMKNINLIDFLTRDIISLICAHLELFRASQTKISRQHLGLAAIEHRDLELKSVLAADNKLHPALFGAEAEHKVLQHIMEGLISFTFKPEDLQCSLFRYIVRELLASAVMRPVINLVSPRFINERIESLVISLNKAEKGSSVEQVALPNKPNDHFSQFLDPSAKGVELVQLKKDQPTAAEKPATDSMNGVHSKDPLLSMDTRSTRSWGSLPLISQSGDGKGIQKYGSGGEWGNMLDLMSQRKTEALAPEHFENMWTKGRNYKWKEGLNQSKKPVNSSSSRHLKKDAGYSDRLTVSNSFTCNDAKKSSNPSVISYEEDDELSSTSSDEVESGYTSSYHTEDEETGNVTGLDSPSVKVWDGKSNRQFSVSHIHHPLENFEGHKTRKMDKVRVHSQRHLKTKSGWKRSRLSSHKLPVWQEVERTSFLSGDGQDILNPLKDHLKSEGSSDDYEAENMSRIQSGSAASSSLCSISLPDSRSLANASKNLLLLDSFLKLRCEVTGANIVKSGSKTFAVYSISVTDVNNNSWSVKRRFRHFEELHRRLKEYPEYNLHLPPKHFFSTGLDVPVIQERCKLLDVYLKSLLELPTISGSIEVWDFLSIDSQSYIFSNSISIVDTLSVDADITTHEKSKYGWDTARPKGREDFHAEGTGSAPLVKNSITVDAPRLNSKNVALSPPKKSSKERGKSFEDSGSESDNVVQKITCARNSEKVHESDGSHAPSELLANDATDPTIPVEWVPPNLSAPMLDLVDVIFQLQDGGWIRRKAFWVAKQVLQLGMGDALDDWLIDKIQLLRKGSVVASGIRRVEQILWPDGIFITKHPKRQRPSPSGTSNINSLQGQSSAALSSPKLEDIQKVNELQQKEMERRAKLVHELMIDNAPAAIVGLVGRKEYEQCANDVYYFLQSSVCLKQLAYGLLELLLLSAFPELDYVFKQLHAEKEKFGHYRPK